MKTKNNVLIFYALAVLASMSIGCKEYNLEGDANAGSGDKRTTLAGSTPQIKPLPVVYVNEWDPSGAYKPGDHTQHMQGVAYSESDPNRIYMGQDVSNVWVSTNFGGSWSTLICKGLGSSFVTSIEVDPVDKNRILASVNCRSYASINEAYQGIYLSTNGGVDWTLAKSRTKLAAVRSSTKLMAYAPTSKGTSYASRWYAAFGEGDESVPAEDGLLTSSNGGVSWTQLMDLPKSIFGEDIRGIKVHKQTSSVLFLYGTQGLFKFTGATSASTIAYTKISGASGSNKLPAGDIKGAIYQSDNGNTLIVPVDGLGIYKSTDAGVTWTQLYAKSDIAYCYVNEKFPQKMFATSTIGNNQIKISDDGGSSWWSPATADVEYRPDYGTQWNNKLGGDFAYVLPDPNDIDRIFMHSKSKNYISTDGGHEWTWRDNGYNAASHSSLNADQMFDPGNAKRFCYFMVDRGPVVSLDKGKWFKEFNKPAGAGQTCIGGAVQPGTQVILASVGMNGVAELLRSTDNGDNWTRVQATSKNRWVVGFSLQNKNICYQWRERSDDSGASWNEMTAMPASSLLCGISRMNGDIIYAMKLEGDGNTKKIYRSTDRGDSWSTNPIITSTWDLTVPGISTQFVFKVHPTDDNILFTSSASGEITKWNLSAGTHVDFDIIPNSDPGPNYIHRFAIDPQNPLNMYAINMRVNTGNKFFRSTDGGSTWENLSNYVPQGSLNGLAVSPVTGEVYISGENGSMVMLRPDNNSSNTAYSVVPYTMSHITAPY